MSNSRLCSVCKVNPASRGDKKRCLECNRKRSNRYTLLLKAKIIEFLGGSCVQCGNSDPRVLEVDHVNGGGHKHVQLRGTHGVRRDILSGLLPREEVQLLCANCHRIKTVSETTKEAEWWESYKETRRTVTFATTVAGTAGVSAVAGSGPTTSKEWSLGVRAELDEIEAGANAI